MEIRSLHIGVCCQRFEVGKHGYLEREDWMLLSVDGATGQVKLCTPVLCPRPSSAV